MQVPAEMPCNIWYGDDRGDKGFKRVS